MDEKASYNREGQGSIERARQNASRLYEYSIFFRNYIESTPEDALKNGIALNFLDEGGQVDSKARILLLKNLKVKLKEALRQAMISHRFYGFGYILIQTNGIDDDLKRGVNKDTPTGFVFLEPRKIVDNNPKLDKPYIEYVRNVYEESGDRRGRDSNIQIHKSRLIMYLNYDIILDKFVPVYSQGLITGFELFEDIYRQISKRIGNFNFLHYKDETLVDLMNTIEEIRVEATKLRQGNKENHFLNFLNSASNNRLINNRIHSLEHTSEALERELGKLKNKLHNEGIFYTSNENASLEIVKYDLAFLKDAFELVKAKIGADTKEPLTRSFNEQVKGLGSDGKGDRTNYYDYLKGVQEAVEIAVNSKLNTHYNLDMKFNDIEVLNTEERIAQETLFIDAYTKYLNLEADPRVSAKQAEYIKSNLPILGK
ncbi:phage portal protein (plasmid) [Borrelia turcica IST7]|uniref:Phage portal protein n=1 Tax=Borrelia turcica IST7 TaxID=1104446 RepID=A0A386PQS1_9SPIR|nr:anti-CBASS Acb1 family protein [Borrelia turcica]AYE36997.1 phage portal protein [Borrelia turcica IST7]